MEQVQNWMARYSTQCATQIQLKQVGCAVQGIRHSGVVSKPQYSTRLRIVLYWVSQPHPSCYYVHNTSSCAITIIYMHVYTMDRLQ